MIKKTTPILFADGEYKGEHDWKGGIPLSEGEVMQVYLASTNATLDYSVGRKNRRIIRQRR